MPSKQRGAEPEASVPSPPPAVSRRFVVTSAFFLSGAAGLIFQVVWLYRCGLAFGNTIWAVSVVLSSLMAGLAIGGALAAQMTGGSRRLR
jgi:hypothetical protein